MVTLSYNTCAYIYINYYKKETSYLNIRLAYYRNGLTLVVMLNMDTSTGICKLRFEVADIS